MDIFKRKQLEQFELLKGHSIQKVQYVELNNPEKDYHLSSIHNFDFGMLLLLSNDKAYYFGWDTTVEQFIFNAGNMPVPPHLREKQLRVWDVSSDPAWTPFIGKEIISINPKWQERYWQNAEQISACVEFEISFQSMKPTVAVSTLSPVFNEIIPIPHLHDVEGHIFVRF